MQIKLILFLTILTTIMVNTARPFNVTQLKDNRNIGKPFTDKSPEERRKLSLFPKNYTKFTVSTKQPKEDDISEEASTHKNTRPPLMKRIRYTTMAAVTKQPTEPSNDAYFIKANVPEDKLEVQTSNYSEVIKEFDGISNLVESTEYPKEELKRMGDETVQVIDENAQLTILNGGKFEELESLEEEQVKYGASSEKDVMIDSTESYDFRLRRNVIDEENLGSTVPGFKITGRGSRLNSGLNFNNINV